jgi:hypothetical protein
MIGLFHIIYTLSQACKEASLFANLQRNSMIQGSVPHEYVYYTNKYYDTR